VDAGEDTDGDAALVARSLHEPEAFTALFDRYAVPIHRYLARRIGAAHAEDLLAQTFLVAFETRARYHAGRAGVRPWLYGIATNLLRRHRRDEVRQFRAFARTGTDPDVPCPAEAVAERVDADAAARGLGRALAAMPARDRDVLLLTAWADLPYEEVARALDIPVGTVRSRLHRARARLRAELDGLPAAERTQP
jgi:RNA polymerase sigma factor (sigma-70 family)